MPVEHIESAMVPSLSISSLFLPSNSGSTIFFESSGPYLSFCDIEIIVIEHLCVLGIEQPFLLDHLARLLCYPLCATSPGPVGAFEALVLWLVCFPHAGILGFGLV